MPQLIQSPTRQQARVIANNCLDSAMAALRKSKDLREQRKWLRATACLELAQEFATEGATLACIANGGPEPDSAQEEALTKRAADCVETVSEVAKIVEQEGPKQRTDSSTAEWYRRKEGTILNHQLLKAMERIQGKEEDEREAMAIVAESVLTWNAVDENGNECERERPRATSGEHTLEMIKLESDAEKADKATKRKATQILERYDESLVFECSPRLKAHTDMTSEARKVNASPCSMLLAVSVEEEEGQPNLVVPFIVMCHRGKKIAKHLADPYPKGYPKGTAIAQMEAVIEILDGGAAERDDSQNGPYREARQLAQNALAAAELDIHDLSGRDMERLSNAAERCGLPVGASIKLASAVTGHDERIARSLDVTDEQRWIRKVPKATAIKMIEEARRAGVDDYALTEAAKALGFQPEEAGCAGTRLPEGAIDEIMMEARLTGMSEKAIERMAREL